MDKIATLIIDSVPFTTSPDTGKLLPNDVVGPAMAAFELLLSEAVGYKVKVSFQGGAKTTTSDEFVGVQADRVFNEGKWANRSEWRRLGLSE